VFCTSKTPASTAHPTRSPARPNFARNQALRAIDTADAALWQKWAGQVITVLRETAAAVDDARATGATELDPDLLEGLRQRYDKAVGWGIATNRHRDWHKGNHPGYTLATRLKDKAEQVWLFARNFRVPWTNNASEQALRGPKRHQAVSGYWHRTHTLRDYLRVRSYLVSAHAHGLRAIDAIHTALTGTPGSPHPSQLDRIKHGTHEWTPLLVGAPTGDVPASTNSPVISPCRAEPHEALRIA
jgi:hypothetical protein